MLVRRLRSKIHRATVTGADLSYDGSISICAGLLAQAGLMDFEIVQVVNIHNGARFETYVIPGDPGEICLNGAAARLAQVGDLVIIMSEGLVALDERVPHPRIVRVDAANRARES